MSAKANENSMSSDSLYSYHRKYETPEIFEQAVIKYFETIPEKDWTISGLALFLGLTRSALWKYGNRESREYDGFQSTVEWATTKVEDRVERQLLAGKGGAAEIFWLKNVGWSDRQELDARVSGDVHINVVSYAQLLKENSERIASTNPVQLPASSVSTAVLGGDGVWQEASSLDRSPS